MPFPGPGTAAASGSGQRVYRVCTVVSLLCFTYVRGPDPKGRSSLFYKSPSWLSSLVWFVSGYPEVTRVGCLCSTRVGQRAPPLPVTKDLLSFRRDRKGDLSFCVEAHPRSIEAERASYVACVLTILLYGSECWALTARMRAKLATPKRPLAI